MYTRTMGMQAHLKDKTAAIKLQTRRDAETRGLEEKLINAANVNGKQDTDIEELTTKLTKCAKDREAQGERSLWDTVNHSRASRPWADRAMQKQAAQLAAAAQEALA